jgi:hypothetical protein
MFFLINNQLYVDMDNQDVENTENIDIRGRNDNTIVDIMPATFPKN